MSLNKPAPKTASARASKPSAAARFYEDAPVGCVTLDEKGSIREINRAAAGMLGAERSRLIGRRFSRHVVKDDLPAFREHLRKLSQPDARAATELGLTVQGGGVIRVELQSAPAREAGRKGRGAPSILTDITRWKLDEQALRRSERRYRSLLQAVPDLMFRLNADGTFVDYHAEDPRLLAMPPGQIIGTNIRQATLPAAVIDQSLAAIARVLETGVMETLEYSLPLPGCKREFEMRIVKCCEDEVVTIVRDITQRKLAEAALHRSEASLARAQAIAHFGSYEFSVVDPNDIHWSAETFRILGLELSPTAMPPSDYLQRFVHPDDRERVAKADREAVRNGTPFNLDYRIVRADGALRHVQSIGEPVRDQDGRIVKVFGTVLDITERKQTEVMRSQLAAIVESSADAIIGRTVDGIITSWNRSAEKMFGYTADEILGHSIAVLAAPDRHEELRQIAQRLRRGESIGAFETVRVRKDGRPFDAAATVSLIKDAGGKIIGASAIVRDITGRKRAEEALRRSEANLAHAQKVAHVGSYEFEVSGALRLHWSAETFRILGLDPTRKELFLQEYLARAVHPDDQARVGEAIERTMNEAARYDLEYRIVRPDGSIRHVHSVAEPRLGPDKRVIKVIGALQDITGHKALEKEVLEISEREQNRIGQDLHDGLCQHLAGIEFRLLGLKQKLAGKSNKLAAETAGLARLVRQAIEQTRTLSRGLSPVRSESGGLINALQELAINTEKAFTVACAFNCPAPVLVHDNAVATHLYRIAQEAVQNAIRHGQAKFVVINLFTANHRIVLGVKDDGIGFPTKLRAHSGMGLRVMQYRAGMVGGSLAVQRDPEGGTSVVCSLGAR